MIAPFASPMVHAIFVVTVILLALIEVRQGLRRRSEATRADAGSLHVLRLTYVLGVVIYLVLHHVAASASIRPLALASWLGLTLIWCGMALRLWCFQTLGHYFTFVVQTSIDQPVIDRGPYRVLRHPSYSALLVIYVGVGIVLDNWLALLGFALSMFLGLAYRIHVEESALSTELGGRYQAFAATRKRLIPFIW